jgi:copper chaperone
MTTTHYAVNGMTCEHCVSAVSTEVGQIEGVTQVDVDLAAGSVTVTSETALDDAAVREAIDEAGYEVVSA